MVEKLVHLERLQNALELKLRVIEKRKYQQQVKNLYRPLKQAIVLRRIEEA